MNLYKKLLEKQEKNKLHYLKYKAYYINYYYIKKLQKFNNKFTITFN